MNPFSACCSSCAEENEDSFYPMGNFIPATPGYDQTYSMPAFKPMGVAGPLMGENVARPYPGAPGPVFADQGNPNFPRSNGNANPFYNLSKVKPAGAYAKTGNPFNWSPASAGFQPMGAYATTGNPFNWSPASAGFQPMGAYPSSYNPMGITPVGENMPAQIGHPARMGQGIGGEVQSLGFMV